MLDDREFMLELLERIIAGLDEAQSLHERLIGIESRIEQWRQQIEHQMQLTAGIEIMAWEQLKLVDSNA